MQRNLEQIRALHAHRFWDPAWPDADKGRKRLAEVRGAEGGDIVSKLGPLILECGLLATASLAKQKGGGQETLLREIGRFLGSQGEDGRGLLPKEAPSLDDLVRQLTQSDSPLLRLATAEALLYAGYLKRFAPPKAKPARQGAPLANPLPLEAPHAH